MARALVLFGASVQVAMAQAFIWDLSDHTGSAEQWDIYGRDDRAGLLGLPETAGDFNGDGFSDIAFSGTRTDTYLIFSDGRGGEFNLLSIDPFDPPDNVVVLRRDLLSPGFVSEMSSGDFNHDGIDDLLIGSQTNRLLFSPNSDDFAGAVYIVWGNRDWGGQAVDLSASPPLGFTITRINGVNRNWRVGIWVHADDVDGDGVDDLIFGADQSSGLNADTSLEIGSGFVVYGVEGSGPGTLFGLAGQQNIFPIDQLPAQTALMSIHGLDVGDHFGSTISTGDLDGDAGREVIISAALARSGASIGGASSGGGDGPGNVRPNAGETYILWDDDRPMRSMTFDLGPAPPPNLTVVYGPRMRGSTGEEIWVGDIDGDGRQDLLLGALTDNGNIRGGLWVLYNDDNLKGKTIDLLDVDSSTGLMTVGGDVIRTAEIRGNKNGDILGDTVRAVDLNQDGLVELIVGVPNHSFSETYIFFNVRLRLPPLTDLQFDPMLSSPELAPFHPIRILPINSGDTISYSMHFGDFDNDAYADVLINGMLAPPVGNPPPAGLTQVGHAHFISGLALSRLAGVVRTSADPWSEYGGGETRPDAGSRMERPGAGLRNKSEIINH